MQLLSCMMLVILLDTQNPLRVMVNLSVLLYVCASKVVEPGIQTRCLTQGQIRWSTLIQMCMPGETLMNT